MSESIFELSRGVYHPALESRALWYADALHGGPVAALFAREAEAFAAPVPMRLARLTVDLMRPVPRQPLEVSAHVVREGKRVQVIDAVMTVDGSEVARASALRIRHDEVEIIEHSRRIAPPPPYDLPAARPEPIGELWFHTAGVEMRFVQGGFRDLGVAEVWMRLALPLVGGEKPSPAQRVAAVADFGNGISGVLPWHEYVFINPDLTVYLHRQPIGEWVCLRARTDAETEGIGLAQSQLFDTAGAIGHSLQSLFVDKRSGFDPRAGQGTQSSNIR
ncbi:thioesterase family protein [bacterium]|nr:thioesterase family protein [bacterium]